MTDTEGEQRVFRMLRERERERESARERECVSVGERVSDRERAFFFTT